jgi:hypothetical protein
MVARPEKRPGRIDYSIFMNAVMKKYLIEDHLHRAHLPIAKQHGVTPLFVSKLRRMTMINKAKLTLIAAIAASSLALPAAALRRAELPPVTRPHMVAASMRTPRAILRPLRPGTCIANSRFWAPSSH